MPALKPTDFVARITYLGVVENSEASLASRPVDKMRITFDGADGEFHGGRTRPSCSRVLAQHPRFTEISNVRQFSVLSAEELHKIAEKMELDAVAPEWVGASIVIEGIPDFTHVPPSSRLQAENGTTLIIDMENRPCVLPGKVIEGEREGFGARFKAAATHRRGVTAWVERPGSLSIGDELRLHIPDQRAWDYLAEARK